MAPPQSFFLVSLPSSAFASGHKDDGLDSIRSTVTAENGMVYPFNIPSFKIGTLDALVQQADELAKLDNACHAVVAKVSDSLRNLLDGDEGKLDQQRVIEDKQPDVYLQSFRWHRIKYREDKSVAELISQLQRDINAVDNDVKGKFNQYSSVKTNLAAASRKQTGNLAQRSLAAVVDPKLLVRDSEHLETHLIACPNQQTRDFLKSYEELTAMVVPRSATQVAKDNEFTLYAVTVFKKYGAEFVHKCREKRWTPREYEYKTGGREEEAQEVDKLEKEERKIWGEALRLGRTGYSDSALVWVHVLALRVFVETVLRYGLPLDFVSALVKTSPKFSKKAKQNLDTQFGFLGGNAFGKDKKGRIKQDDQAMAQEMTTAGHSGEEYSAYVFYEFEIP